MNSEIENNKLIADFMNYPKSGIENKDPYYYAMKHCYDNNNMKYHTSWDWLMPVVQKIESLGYEVKITGNCTKVTGIIHSTSKTKIKATYSAVIDSIKYLNNNPQIK